MPIFESFVELSYIQTDMVSTEISRISTWMFSYFMLYLYYSKLIVVQVATLIPVSLHKHYAQAFTKKEEDKYLIKNTTSELFSFCTMLNMLTNV